MCGRFTLTSNSAEVKKHFGLEHCPELAPDYNIHPARPVPVVRLDNGARKLALLHWGLVPHWAKETRLHPINAKAESVADKPFFRSAYRNRRCLVPANGFYEWRQENRHKQPYYFTLKQAGLMAFAGIWDEWQGNDARMESCAIITTTANAIMQPVHNRMPVILDPDDYDTWLQEGDRALLQPYPGDLIAYPVSTTVNNPRHQGSDLIAAI